jgi:hypothetical protein
MAPELKFVVEEKRGVVDVFTTWVPRIVIVAFFAFVGATKFDARPDGMWVKVFDQIGFGQWFRYFTGAVQIAGAVLILNRRTRAAGTALLASTMAGAALVDAFVMGSPGYALLPLILMAAVIVIWLGGINEKLR